MYQRHQENQPKGEKSSLIFLNMLSFNMFSSDIHSASLTCSAAVIVFVLKHNDINCVLAQTQFVGNNG